MNFAERLKHLRIEKGYSVRDLALKCGISKSTISMYEKASRKPKHENLEAIADVFNVDIDYLLCKTDVRNAYNFSPDKAELTEGEKMLLELFRKIPQERQAEALELLRIALRMQIKP